MTQPKLSVHAGPSLSSLKRVDVNSSTPLDVSSASFKGRVAVRIADYLSPDGKTSQPSSTMSDQSTWSIVVQGKWLEETSADDIVSIPCSSALYELTADTSTRNRCLETVGINRFEILCPMALRRRSSSCTWSIQPLITTFTVTNLGLLFVILFGLHELSTLVLTFFNLSNSVSTTSNRKLPIGHPVFNGLVRPPIIRAIAYRGAGCFVRERTREESSC